MMLLILLGSFLLYLAQATAWDTVVLSDRYTLSWLQPESVEGDATINFRIEAATLGWVGLGLSGTSGMADSDIVIAGVRDGVGYVSDRYADSNAQPKEDAEQNVELISASENDTHTVVEIRRKLNTCGGKEDYTITTNSLRVLWAFGEGDPTSDSDFTAHSFETRGVQSLLLLGGFSTAAALKSDLPADAFALDLRLNPVKIPTTDTTYMCRIVEIPKMEKDHHLVRIEFLRELKPYIHHVVLQTCEGNRSHLLDIQEMCGAEPTQLYESCGTSNLAVWAVGMEDTFEFPADTGKRLFDDGYEPYYLLEIHYNNPEGHDIPDLDSSGVRLWLTPSLRSMDFETLILGIPPFTQETLLLPPRQHRLTMPVLCPSHCLAGLPEEGVKIHTGFLHTHESGTAVRLRHIRNNTELEPILYDQSYDPSYQNGHILTEDRRLLPGDELVAECDYSTKSRSNLTLGGFRATDEMCFVFVGYYPRVKGLEFCFSSVTNQTLREGLGLSADADILNEAYKMDFGTPEKEQKRSPLAQRYQDALDTGSYDILCSAVAAGGTIYKEHEGSSVYQVPQPSNKEVKTDSNVCPNSILDRK